MIARRSCENCYLRDLSGQSILVTGAGGYIGSELVKTIATAKPGRLVLLDSCEQSLFEVSRSVPGELILGSVTDPALLDDLFHRFQPNLVYHTAAYKHVPLLEANPFAAIHNNAIGTYTLVQALLRHSPARLVLLSTDKAVNPRSFLGVSKRIAELTVVSLATERHPMNALRLGNVIGSTGSVIPIFRQQIAAGEAVTVTHPEATRYFLSLAKAVEAILAGAAADCFGRILLPELGAPVRIEDLARSLMGESHIPIRYIGLRPGDKLSEDLLFANEVAERTSGPLTVVRTPALHPTALADGMERLRNARTLEALLPAVRALVCQ
jgi:FlaA1/EpsC-like NDP-sugar epimerase